MALDDTLRDLADTDRDAVSKARGPLAAFMDFGTVTSHTSTSVTVLLDSGNTVTGPFDSGYSPTTADVVWVLFRSGSPFIAGAVTGRVSE